jgi:hypothetical protein
MIAVHLRPHRSRRAVLVARHRHVGLSRGRMGVSPQVPWHQVEVFGTGASCLTVAHREAGLRYAKESRRRFIHPGSVELSGPAVVIPTDLGDV